MATDWAAISGIGVGGMTLLGAMYQSRRGERSADRDNRFEVLKDANDRLERDVEACRKREQEAAARYKAQDDDAMEMRRLYHDGLDAIDTLHQEAREKRILHRRELNEKDRQIADLESQIISLGGTP